LRLDRSRRLGCIVIGSGAPFSVRRLKRALARVATTDPVGRAVAVLTRNRVRTKGLVFDTSRKEFTPSIKARMFFGLYEDAEIQCIRKYLGGASQVIELGSSLGITSAHILDVMAPGGTLTCVEANPLLLDALRATVSAAERRTGRHATVIHAAVSSALSGEGEVARLAFGRSSLGAKLREEMGPPSDVTVDVPTVSLSALVAGMDGYALVADIEGAEAALIAEGREPLSRASRAVIELHRTRYRGRVVSVEDMKASLLHEHGFHLLGEAGRVLALGR